MSKSYEQILKDNLKESFFKIIYNTTGVIPNDDNLDDFIYAMVEYTKAEIHRENRENTRW
jgi:hypothetical protein